MEDVKSILTTLRELIEEFPPEEAAKTIIEEFHAVYERGRKRGFSEGCYDCRRDRLNPN